MSDSPRSSATFHPTKQQLDELDALMKQMLALPGEELSEFDEEKLLPGTIPTPGAVHHGQDSAPLLVPEPGVATESNAPLEAQARLRLNPSPLLLRPDAERIVPRQFGTSRVVADDIEPSPSPVHDDLAWWQLPLAGLNLLFDFLVVPLGPIGRWLMQPGGRALLGVLGLMMLSGAIVWGLLDWLGWTW